MRNARVCETSSPKQHNKAIKNSSHLPEILNKSNIKLTEDQPIASLAQRSPETVKVASKFKDTICNSKMYLTRRKEEIKADTLKPDHKDNNTWEREYRNIMDIPKLSTNILEVWINTTLKDMETMTIPKQYLNIEGKTPLSRFGIDREKLLVIKYSYI